MLLILTEFLGPVLTAWVDQVDGGLGHFDNTTSNWAQDEVSGPVKAQ